MADANPVSHNYMALQIMVAQQKLHDTFPYSPDMDTCYWISGATDLCSVLSLRNPADIARLLTAELRNSRPIQDVIEQHIAAHDATLTAQATLCSSVCLLSFALSTDEVYTKSPADLTSALARYITPPTMDVSEHLTAHLAKEEDRIRRRNLIFPLQISIPPCMERGRRRQHTAGSVRSNLPG